MANPRKFSEKIALLNQKQAEGNAQFEQVMREVSDATKRVNALPKSQKHLRITQTLRGGSLPNVNHTVNAAEVKPDQGMGALGMLEELKKGSGATPVPYHRERDRDRVGPVRLGRSTERRMDKSPYSGPYLSPPPDSSWRRTNSDSALHQSASGGMVSNSIPCQQIQYDIPGINIYPSIHEQGGLQIPISNNTGSLPDLTCFQFSSPLHTPLDQEEHNTSPGGTCTVSPSGGRLHINRVPSPHAHGHQPLAQVLNRRRGYQQQNLILSPLSPSHPGSEDGIYSHLAVPSLYNHSKVVTGEMAIGPSSKSPGQQDQQQDISNNYRNSHPQRPSPQNSPSLTVSYRSQSPHSPHSPHSAPASPSAGSPAGSPSTHQTQFSDYNNYLTQSQLQHHFEQFNMDWCQLVQTLVESGTSWSLQMDTPTSASLTYIASPPNNTNSRVLSPEDSAVPDGGYYSTSPSQMQFGKPGSAQHTTPNTPNTPSSIPDIIVADFSEGPNDLGKSDLEKDLVQFDTDLFPSDDALREGLGTIDFDGYQMLTDPGMLMISDPSAEDAFRLDRL